MTCPKPHNQEVRGPAPKPSSQTCPGFPAAGFEIIRLCSTPLVGEKVRPRGGVLRSLLQLSTLARMEMSVKTEGARMAVSQLSSQLRTEHLKFTSHHFRFPISKTFPFWDSEVDKSSSPVATHISLRQLPSKPGALLTYPMFIL